MNEILEKDLVEKLGLENLPRQKQLEIIERTGSVIFNSIMQEAILRISEIELDALDTLLSDPKNTDKVYDFLKEKVDKFDELVEKVITDFKKDAFFVLESLK